MSEKPKLNPLIIGIVVCLAAFAALSVAAAKVQEITPTPELAAIVAFIQAAVIAAPVAVAFALGRNLYGYGIKYLEAKRMANATVEVYSLRWLGETVVKFEGVLVLFTPFIIALVDLIKAQPGITPYQIQMITTGTAAFIAFIDILISELKKIIP
jgi:hypothetical protein